MSDLEKTENKQEMQIDIDPGVAMALKIQEYDKHIADAEAVVSDLKRQRADYIYQTNVQAIISQYKAKQAQS